MALLSDKHCVPCEGGVAPLKTNEILPLLQAIPGWAVNESHTEISRDFHFKNYYHTMTFVNATAWISHEENHHPDLEVGYNHCKVRYSTHAIKGLSENDFICAAKINALFSKEKIT